MDDWQARASHRKRGEIRFATTTAAFTPAREICTVALYRYAARGEAPSGYDAATMGSALRRP